MSVNNENCTLWNSTSVSSGVIPEDFQLPTTDESQLFCTQSEQDLESVSEPYETKFDENNLAYVVS